jgi:hypothetical protein
VLINRWVANQIVDWPPSNCFGCKRPIVVGAKWVELVRDDNRARFHCDCEPVWRAKQEVAAHKALWGSRERREEGQMTGGTLDGASDPQRPALRAPTSENFAFMAEVVRLANTHLEKEGAA